MSFVFTRLAVADVVLVEPTTRGDERGWFREMFKADAFAEWGIPTTFVQENASSSTPGVLRGLHFQRPPFAQGKLVSVTMGAVFDVAVDVRTGSPTFGQWVGEELSAENGRQLWIPEGFAHGFCVVSESSAQLSYKVTNVYSGPHDGGVQFDDPAIGIDWPISNPVLSDKDRNLPLLADCDHGFSFDASV
jgi:dTDP-4-dehydrorhamnose 3,5-epimerase